MRSALRLTPHRSRGVAFAAGRVNRALPARRRLLERRALHIAREIVEGYTRMPQGGEFDVDEWGDLGRMMEAITVETFRRMEEEERGAGFEPW